MPPIKFEVLTPEQVEAAEQQLRKAGKLDRGGRSDHAAAAAPSILTVADLLALEVSPRKNLVEGIVSGYGATLVVGPPKSNKTLVAMQIGIAVAANRPAFDYYRVLESGSVLVIEQDDPAGPESIKQVLERSRVPVTGIPFFLVPRVSFTFNLEFIDWLEKEILERDIRLVILDSYTALRTSRGRGVDIVKAEYNDMNMLDELAKRTSCAILVVHHDSKGSAGLHWTQKAAGTFAMTGATEGQIHISRFSEFDSNAPERLVCVQGRHLRGIEIVLRFREESLDHDRVIDGGAAAFFPLLVQLKAAFEKQMFSPKDMTHATGVSIATAHRHIGRLCQAGALKKHGHGEYVVVI